MEALLSRRTLVFGAPAAIVTAPLLSGCGAGVVAALNPVTQQLLIGVAGSLGATALTYIGEKAVEEVDKQWAEGFSATHQRTLPGCQYFADSYATPGGSGVLLTEYVVGESPGTPYGPLVRGCAITIGTKGEDAVVLPSWAYQTVAAFTTNYLSGRDGVSLAEGEALMATSLAPTSSKTHEGASLAGSVQFLSYTTARGPVDVSLWEQPDHTRSGRIKVSGLPDGEGGSVIWECILPTAEADTQRELTVITA